MGRRFLYFDSSVVKNVGNLWN